MAAEAPAPAPTSSLEDEVYDALKMTIGHAFEQSDDNNTACLVVHKAMARAMADVVTDRKFTEDGEIDITAEFIEKWALTQLLMKDKLDNFMWMRIHATNAAGATLVINERVPYRAPDIETGIEEGLSPEQEAQSQALNRLKLVYGHLAYILAHENPAVKTALDQKIQEIERVENTDNMYKGHILKSLNEEKENIHSLPRSLTVRIG